MGKGFLQRLVFFSTISVMVVILFMIIYSKNGVNDWQHLSRELSDIQEKNKELDLANRELTRTIERLKTDMGYIEHVARHELGMTARNEVIFRLKEK
ncbi:MAG: septum formation initiator family protein [Desulfobacterium sp.]|jgi:cell division protein FtsB|nr:septum formation initiator family protein [Desulfobacterium sp.]